MLITSLENEKIKNYSKLQQKKYRDLTNEYLVEGKHLVLEAQKNNVLKEVLLLEEESPLAGIPFVYVTPDIMKKLSTLDTPSTIIGICAKKNVSQILGHKILLLDAIRDPGNLGTIIRSAAAFNVDTLVLSEDTVDLYNPKVLRSTQGMYHYLNIIEMPLEKALSIIKENKIPLYGTNVNEGTNVKELSHPEKYALIMGNEGQGVKKEIAQLCEKNIYIPMNKNVESLNVAIATSILLYELDN